MRIDPAELLRLTQKPFSSWWVFHDSSLDAVLQDGNTVQMKLSGYVDEDDKPWDASVCFQGIQNIKVDGSPSKWIGMELNDGEVLTLNPDGQTLTLVVIWSDFASKTTFTRGYTIDFDSVYVDFNMHSHSNQDNRE